MTTETELTIAEAMEPFASLPTMTAHEARLKVWGADPEKWIWTTSDEIESPLGWWSAIIGTDHGPDDQDDKPVRWRETYSREPWDNVGDAWLVVEEMRRRDWVVSIDQDINDSEWRVEMSGPYYDERTVTGSGDIAHAICEAALSALRQQST